MDIATFYDYLRYARQVLWTALEAVPDDTLAEAVIPGPRFHSPKDLLFHISAAEDWWLHENILQDSAVWDAFPDLGTLFADRYYADTSLPRLLEYAQQVEARTLAYLAHLTPQESGRTITFRVAQGEVSFIVKDALWHVMQHEVRHTAQVVLLLRQAGVTPPELDLDNYLLARQV